MKWKFRETGNSKHLHWNELDKTCFAYDEVFSNCKGLAKRTISDRILKARAYKLLKIIWWISKSISKYVLFVFLIRKQDQKPYQRAKWKGA